MTRGDIVAVAQKGVFSGKPRPAVIVQATALLDAPSAVVVCLLTGDLLTDPPFYRIDVEPDPANGLAKRSQIMADLPTPIRAANIGPRIGALDADTLARLNTALALFLELA